MTQKAQSPLVFAMPTIFGGIQDFYNTRGGEYSPESLYGNYNKDDLLLFTIPGRRRLPYTVKICYVHDTGDFYAQDDRGTGKVALLGSVGAGVPEDAVMSHFSDYWKDMREAGRSIGWFQARIGSFKLG